MGIGDVEPGRHHTRHPARGAIHDDSLADDVGRTGERALPQLVRQRRNRLTVGHVLFGIERPANHGADTQRPEQIAGRNRRGDAHWCFRPRDAAGARTIAAQRYHRPVALFQLEEFRR
jgi:hypothetical protein